MTREAVVEEVKKAHIRGRGGAGFDCGTKWSFMPKEVKKPHYLVVNADEGEPGTFKDRTIMEQNPHALIEGCIIGCFGIGAHAAYIYVRDELHLAKERLWDAIGEAKQKGYLGKTPVRRARTRSRSTSTPAPARTSAAKRPPCSSRSRASAASRASSRRSPRSTAPSACPPRSTTSRPSPSVPTVFELGGDAFSRLSDLHAFNDGGARLFGVSGHVNKPGIYECAVGLTLRELIYDLGGGVQDGRELLGVIPGGLVVPGASARTRS